MRSEAGRLGLVLRVVLLALGVVALPAGCGRSPFDLDELGSSAGSGSTSTSPDDHTGDAPLPLDLPPEARGCEEQGGRLTQVGGPWVLQSHIPDYAPAYALLPGDDEMLAIWRGPFDGSNPMPNFLGAHVGYDGQLRSMTAPVWERPVTQEPAVHRGAEGWIITYCGRFGAEDEVTSQVLDAQGVSLSAEVVREPPSSCGAARPEGVWTGEVYLFTWTDNSTHQLFLDVADAQLTSLGALELLPDGNLSSPPRIAVGPTGALLAAGFTNDLVLAFELGLDGKLLDVNPVQLPPEVRPGPLAVGARQDGGYAIFTAHRNEPGLYVTRFEGGVAGEATRVEGADARYGDLLLLHRAGGYLLVAEANDERGATWIGLIATDERGVPTAIDGLTAESDSLFQAQPAAVMHGEDAWVLYLAGFDDGFDVRLAQVGCVR